MTPAQIQALKNLIAYLADAEAEHFEECSEEERQNHIYNDILILEQFIEQTEP